VNEVYVWVWAVLVFVFVLALLMAVVLATLVLWGLGYVLAGLLSVMLSIIDLSFLRGLGYLLARWRLHMRWTLPLIALAYIPAAIGVSVVGWQSYSTGDEFIDGGIILIIGLMLISAIISGIYLICARGMFWGPPGQSASPASPASPVRGDTFALVQREERGAPPDWDLWAKGDFLNAPRFDLRSPRGTAEEEKHGFVP
jgi:hypothetical protein